jgi:flagellar biosynthesis chaperone FliJ
MRVYFVMVKFDEERSDLDIARRQESQAHNELDYRERQAQEQRSQLDALVQHRKECIDGLKTAKNSGLTPVHVREFQLLMTHIDSVIEITEHKVEASQENYEKAKAVWHEKNEKYVKEKEVMKQALIPDDETISSERKNSKGATGRIVDKDHYGDRVIPVQRK